MDDAVRGTNGAPDPFATLPPLSAAQALRKAEPELWEPRLPAPAEPPAAQGIRHPKHGVAAACWTYRDAGAAPLFAVVRFVLPDGRKEMLPYTFGRRAWTTRAGHRHDITGWHFKAPSAPRPLYGLDRLAAAPDAPVLVCEGEKAADAAAALFPDRVAVTSQGGSKAAGKSDWSPLAGRAVVIWPDHDAAGAEYAAEVAQRAEELGAAPVRIVAVPADWPRGWDLADPAPAGVGAAQLVRMIEDAPAASANPGKLEPEAEIDRLASLASLDFSRERRSVASRLGMTVRDLERAVLARRKRAFREREEAERDRQRSRPGAVVWPPGFRMEANGLVHLGDSDDALPVTVCGPFEVLGESRTAAGKSWGLWLAWRDRDGRRHQWAMQRRLLMAEPGALEAELSDRGLRIGATAEARALLRVALAEVETTARVTAVPRTGWHTPAGGAPAYVLADGAAIGSSAEPLVLLNPAEDGARRVAASGTLDGWKHAVAALARGNPVAVFCVAAAFAGALLEPAGEDGGGAHLFGPSKRGKTVAMKLAASVWGPPAKDGALRDWRTTSNALEAACEEAADGLLALDEIQQADPREVVGAIYAMANGGGKGRLRADASARRRRTWRTYFLSNGEVDVATVAQKAAQRVPPGAEVRLPSVPLPALLWPALHGRTNFQVLCADLATAAVQEHGTAGLAFVERIAASLTARPGALARHIDELRDAFLAAQVSADADPQVREVARRMALVAAAGEIATEFGIVPWARGEATAAAGVVFRQWRDQRGGEGSGEDVAHLAKVRLFIVQHGASRMQPICLNGSSGAWEEVNDPARPVVNRAGWRRRDVDGTDLYLFPAETWRREVCDGLDPAEVARTLLLAGHLEPGDGKNLGKRETIPGIGRPRVYVVRASLLITEEVCAETG